MSLPIRRLATSQRAVFLINSRLGLFAETNSRWHPFYRRYGAILPSSLGRFHSRALEYSSRIPVSVCGTGYLMIHCINFPGTPSIHSLRPRLSSRLTLGGRTFPRKPYPYGGMDFDHTFRYSCLDSHFQKLHALSQSRFYVVGTLSYQLLLIPQIRRSTLVPIIFGANSLDG